MEPITVQGDVCLMPGEGGPVEITHDAGEAETIHISVFGAGQLEVWPSLSRWRFDRVHTTGKNYPDSKVALSE